MNKQEQKGHLINKVVAQGRWCIHTYRYIFMYIQVSTSKQSPEG